MRSLTEAHSNRKNDRDANFFQPIQVSDNVKVKFTQSMKIE